MLSACVALSAQARAASLLARLFSDTDGSDELLQPGEIHNEPAKAPTYLQKGATTAKEESEEEGEAQQQEQGQEEQSEEGEEDTA